MTQRCCVCRVEKTREANLYGLRFFLFPSTKSALYGEWIRAIKIEGKNPHFKLKRTSIICSKHFTDENFFVRRDGRLRLKDDAKPTIFDLPTVEPIPVESEFVPTNVAQPETNNADMKDDYVSDSPPDLFLAVSEYNSDYEENAEEPPDLDIYSDAQVDHSGSVADSLGLDDTVELDMIDDQPIVSFLSVEEMEEYSGRHGSSNLSGSVAITNESSGSRSFQGKYQTGFGQPTPSPSPSSYQLLEGANVPVFSDDSFPPTTTAFSVDMYNDKKGASIIIAEPSPSTTDEEGSLSSTPASENSGGSITSQFAEYAVSAVSVSQRGRNHAHSAKKSEEEASPPLPRKKAVSVASKSKTVQPPNQEAEKEEVSNANLVMTGVGSREEVPVVEEDYLEVYDVPGKAKVSAGSCGKLFCQMGCVCSSLDEATSRITSTEHCSRPDCMLQCVCGYLPGKPSSRRTFVSLLKGNEAFYSKINWSRERSQRERKVPERFSEFHLNKDSMYSPEENSVRSAKQKNANNRSTSLLKLSNKVTIQLQQQKIIKTKPEPLRIKTGVDEIKLLRWNSFVSLKKIYVAPDQEVYCIEHSNTSCPCILENHRIIRILNKFNPPNVQVNQSNVKKDPVVSLPNEKSARKHTHPNMRTAHLKGSTPINGSASPDVGAPSPTLATSSAPSSPSVPSNPPGQVPLNNPEGNDMSKMQKLLQDERFQLPKLMKEEKMRAFDDEVDLAIRSGQTVQLVAWMRFHSVYHSGKMHIRHLSRRGGSVILVMKPTDIVAADITCDIQDMKDKPNIPEIVKDLLDTCISPEETSRYAFLFCDGVKWELVGCLSLKASILKSTPTLPQSKLTKTAQKSLQAPSSSAAKKKQKNAVIKTMPEIILENYPLTEEYQPEPSIPKAIPGKSSALAVPNTSKYEDISTEERHRAIELKRNKLEERLNQINSKLYSAPVKVSFPARSMKPKMQKPSSTAKDPLLLSSPSVKEPLPTSNTRALYRSTDYSFNQCILLDDMSKHCVPSQSNGSDSFLNGDHSNGSSRSRYPAAEKLAMFSQKLMSNRDAKIVGIKTSSLNPMSTPEPRPLASSTAPLPSPTSLPIRPDVQLMKLPSIGVRSVPPKINPTGPKRLRFIPPLQRMSNDASIFGQKSLPNDSLADRIRLQRLIWTNKGVIPPVVVENVSVVGPSSITPSMSVTAVTASTSTAPVLKIIPITNTSAASVLKAVAVTLSPGNQVGESSNTVVHKPSATVTSEKLQTTINTSANSERAEVITVSPIPSQNKTQEDDTNMTNEKENKNSFFPKVLSTQVGPVRLPKPTEEGRTQGIRLKISFAALTGEHRDLSPAPSTMLLPIYDANDEWCMVACPAVPEAGLHIPGINVLIPRNVFERVATTAVERKARVSYPLYIHGKVSNSILKKGFGVYGTPQLPHHIFLGPFRTEYLDSFETITSYMLRISSKTEAAALPEPLTPVIVSVTSTKELSDSQTTRQKPIEERPVGESTETVPATTDKEYDVVEPKPVNDSPVPKALESSPSLEDPSNNKTNIEENNKKNEKENNNSFFPKVLSAHFGPVRLTKQAEEGSAQGIRLKISFAALTGEHRDLSPAPSTMLLPVYDADDEWCMVACPAVPKGGLRIPGVNVFIPRNVFERAATTAVERKARVSYPLHFHGTVSNPILKKGFGVHGTPQLPHHVFLGPFRTEYLDSFKSIPTCLFRISSNTEAATLPEPLTPKIISGMSTEESSDSQSTEEKPIEERPVDESTEAVPAAADKEDDMMEPKPVNNSPLPEAPENPPLENLSNAPSDNIAGQNVKVPVTSLGNPADLNEPVPEIPEKGFLECVEGMPESAGEDNVSNLSTESQQDSGVDDKSSCESAQKSVSAGEESDVKLADGCKRNLPLLKLPVTPAPRTSLPKGFSLPNLPKDFGTHKSTKPQRIFVARTQGLPTTTVAIFEDNLVLVKHPFKPEKTVSFSGVDAAKRWLQSLTVPNQEQGALSTERKRSAPADKSSSTSAAPKRERLEKSDVSDPASSASSPKRVRRLTEKARMLAAQSSRHNQVLPEPERSMSVRGPHSRSVQGSSPKPGSKLVTHNQHSSFNNTNRNGRKRRLNFIKEQERRVLLRKLFRDLDSIIAPNSGVRAKIVVLKNAASTIKSLEEKNKTLSGQCEMLKTHRVALLKTRQKMFNELPNETREIFECLMDTVPEPARHVALLAESRSNQSHPNESVDFESSSNSGFNDPDDIDVS